MRLLLLSYKISLSLEGIRIGMKYPQFGQGKLCLHLHARTFTATTIL